VLSRLVSVVACVTAALALGACGGGDDGPAAGGQSTPSTQSRSPEPVVTAPARTTSTISPIEGVQTYAVEAAHSEASLTYPQVPPVGGIHNPVWQQCAFYPAPVPSEKAVHSLEHGAVWITYRPDLPQGEIDSLADLARARKLVLVSRWDSGLPSPVVATAWGRQLLLQSAADPRLMEFVRLYVNKGPEIDAPC